MAIRNIRTLGDDILRAKAKEITEMTPRIEELIDDMFETSGWNQKETCCY